MYSPQDVYARHLVQSRRGYPLWTPEPNMNLPDIYIREGLKIGDVGVVVPEDGSFDVFFNVCLPPDHSLHRETGVPDNFTPILLSRRDIAMFPDAESAGRIISTTSIARVRDVDASNQDLERREEPGPLNYEFTLSSREGAVLILPEGAERYYLHNERLFMDKAIRHAVDWYNFAEQRLGRIISHDSLYLITGFYKACSWSLAAYLQDAGAGSGSAQFRAVQVGRGNIAASYTWETTHAMDWRVGPSNRYYNGIANQTVFIQGFKIAVREGILGMKRVRVKADSPAVRPYRMAASGSTWVSKARNKTSRSESDSTASPSKGTGTSFSTDTNEDNLPVDESDDHGEDITVQRFPEVAKPFHPSDIINQYLLREVPSANIAITHDSQWTSLLEKGSLDQEELSQEGCLMTAVTNNYSVASAQGGAAYLDSEGTMAKGDDDDVIIMPHSIISSTLRSDTPLAVPQLPDSDLPGTDELNARQVKLTMMSTSVLNKPMISDPSKPAEHQSAMSDATAQPQTLSSSTQEISQAPSTQSYPQAFNISHSSSSLAAAPEGGCGADATLTQALGRMTMATPPCNSRPINVILFGEPGVGKSAVVNLIARKNIARVSSDVRDRTLQATRYDILIDDMNFCVFETVGIEKTEMRGNSYLAALQQAYEFVKKLSAVDGVHLLLFCIQATKLTQTTQSNYRLFSEVVLPTKLPIAIVVTGLEGEVEMEDWWTRNKTVIEQYGLGSDGHACITTTTDRTHRQEYNYAQSQIKIRELLRGHCLKKPVPLPEPHDWFLRFGTRMHLFVKQDEKPMQADIITVLTTLLKLRPKTVQRFLEMMERGSAQPGGRDDTGTPQDPPFLKVAHQDSKGEVEFPVSNTKLSSQDSGAGKWTDEPQNASVAEAIGSRHALGPGKRDKSGKWGDGAQRTEMIAGKATAQPQKMSAPLATLANVKSETKLLMEDIRLSFPLDLTGYVTRYDKHPIASGGYGDTYRGRISMRGKSTDVALKVYKMYLAREDDPVQRMKQFDREVNMWLNLQHPNVLPLLGTIREPDIRSDVPITVCPWVENGSLSGYLERYNDTSIANRLILVNDVALGLQYLHSQFITHGELSGSNVLVRANVRACIADFGLSTSLRTISGRTLASSRHNKDMARWMAPELLDLDDSHTPPTPRSDAYSFGCIMLQILTGNIPYYRLSCNDQVIGAIVKGTRPDRSDQKAVTNDRWKFIESCWSHCSRRPSSDEIVEFARRELAVSLRVSGHERQGPEPW